MRKLFATLALLALTACGQAADEQTASPLRDKLRGQNLATFTYPNLDGQETTLQSLTTGKPVLVNYWATWCVPCVLELPSLLRLQQQGKFDVIAVSFDADPALVKQFWADKNLGALPLLFDRGGTKTGQSFGISGVPTTLVLDQQFVIQGLEEGGREWDHAATIAKIYTDLRNPAQPKGN